MMRGFPCARARGRARSPRGPAQTSRKESDLCQPIPQR